MKKIIPLIFLPLLFVACEKIQQHDLDRINTTITNMKGMPLEEAASGTILRLSAPEFKELNKSIELEHEGTVLFDKLEAKIIAADDDYIITAVPILDVPDPSRITLQLAVSANPIAVLCMQCIYYRPTVSGEIFSGFKGEEADGTFINPGELIHDGLGNLYVIDQRASNHDVIIKINVSGESSLFAGGADEFGRLVGIGINKAAGLLLVADATAQQVKSIPISSPSLVSVVAGSGLTGNDDGIGATASFHFSNEQVYNERETGQGLTTDASGNIYVGDLFATGHSITHVAQLRKITPSGTVSTITGSRVMPTSLDSVTFSSGVAINSTNDLFTTTGSSTLFQGINKFTAGGVFSRFVGRTSSEALTDGTGLRCDFASPKAISHFNGFFYVADGVNGALRRVSPGGKVITLAGVGRSGTSSGPGGYVPPLEGSYMMESSLVNPVGSYYLLAARAIRMDNVGGVTAVHGGLIYVSDYGYKCIWKITIR